MTMKEPLNGVTHTSTSTHTRSNKPTAAYPGAQSWTAVEQGSNGNPGKAPPRIYPHIKDLNAEAQKRVKMCQAAMPVRTLLGQAQASVTRVKTDATYNRQDLAFVEYVVSSEILLNLIPKHKDFPSIKTDRGQYGQLYTTLRRQNDAQIGMFLEIKQAITDDNIKNGTEPAAQSSSSESIGANGVQQTTDRNGRRDSLPGSTTRKQSTQDELFLEQRSRSPHPQPNTQLESRSRSKLDSSPHRERPVIHSKPVSLHARPISRDGVTQSAKGDALSERFSQLRIAQRISASGPNGTSQVPTMNNTSMPSPSEYTSSSEASSIVRTHSHSSSGETDFPGKPSGPRAMPLPPKVPPPPPEDTSQSRRGPRAAASPCSSIRSSKNQITTAKYKRAVAEQDGQLWSKRAVVASAGKASS